MLTTGKRKTGTRHYLLVAPFRHHQAESAKPTGRKPAKKETAQSSLDPDADYSCDHFPFPKVFDYIDCNTYTVTFKGGKSKNDVVPTKDFQYSDALNSGSITDMELL